MTLRQPPWYTAGENFLLDKGRVWILILLAAVILISLYYFVRVYRRESAIPAATWLTYVLLP